MKKLFNALFFAGLTCSMLVSACKSDKCKDISCTPNSQCNEGECLCNTGYVKVADSCTLNRNRFLGTYNVTFDSCTRTRLSAPYTTTIETTNVPTDSIYQVKISNMRDRFSNLAQARIEGDKITIPRQNPDADTYSVWGTGTISGNTITWTYYYSKDDINRVDTFVNTIWQKQ
jgi:hypothetical protein